MDRAYTADYQLIKAENAVKGRKYFCPACNGELHFYPGTINIPHFRHGKGVPKEVKDACELYSQNLDERNMYDQEYIARQSVRLVINEYNGEYQFELKFPLLQQSNIRMQNNDMYFNYHCEQIPDFQFNTVRLLPARQDCEIEVPLLSKYTFYCTNQRYEKMLGLRVSGNFEPFIDGAVIFKEIQSQFISIPYRKLTLSGRFFIVSLAPLISIHPDITVITKNRQMQYFIYELVMPLDFSDDLQNWFARIIGYTLLTSTCHLDIIKPVSFRKIGTTFELNCPKSSWLVTNIGIRHMEQRLILIKPNNRREVIKVPLNRIVELNLSERGDYLLFVDQELTEMLTVRYSPVKLKHLPNFRGQASINKIDTLFKIRELRKEKIELETDLGFYVQTDNDLNYEIKYGGKYFLNSPLRIDFPTLWSVAFQNPSEVSNDISVDDIFRIYESYQLYPKVVCTINDLQQLESAVRKSNYVHKEKIIYFIRRFGIRVPKPISKIIKGLKKQ